MTKLEEMVAKLEEIEAEVDRNFKHFIDSGIWYCSIRECQHCKHPTMQQSIGLQGEKGNAHMCLSCGKIWHREQTIVEYTGN